MLVQRTTTQEVPDFADACNIARSGGKVVICRTPDSPGEYTSLPHPKGLMIMINEDEIWLNETLLHKGPYDDCMPVPNGVIILRDNELIYCDGVSEKPFPRRNREYTDWIPHCRGSCLVFQNEIWLNNTRLVYRGDIVSVSTHTNGGIVVRTLDEFLWISL